MEWSSDVQNGWASRESVLGKRGNAPQRNPFPFLSDQTRFLTILCCA